MIASTPRVVVRDRAGTRRIRIYGYGGLYGWSLGLAVCVWLLLPEAVAPGREPLAWVLVLVVAASELWLNRWLLAVTLLHRGQTIHARRGVFPFRRGLELRASDIERLQILRTRKPELDAVWTRLRSARLQLAARTRTGARIVLAPDLPNERIAREARAALAERILPAAVPAGTPRLESEPAGRRPGTDAPTSVLPPPPTLRIEERGSSLWIRKSWSTRKQRRRAGLALAVAAAWAAFGLVMLLCGGDPDRVFSTLVAVMSAPLVAWGVGLLTARTTIVIDGHFLRVRDRRSLLTRRRQIPTDRIRQIYGIGMCEDIELQYDVRRFYRYHLVAILEDGSHAPIVPHLEDRAECLFLERCLERFLRIPDRPVAGELSAGIAAGPPRRRPLRRLWP
ncbi:MAG: hypothetical protein JXQ29_11635 [Planctomycetes bacterium]|nr:hypothetical protein [Planctomycetota bacterium]